jgi:hypothetical protein
MIDIGKKTSLNLVKCLKMYVILRIRIQILQKVRI